MKRDWETEHVTADILELVHLLYDTIGHPHRWTVFLERLSVRLDGTMGQFTLIDTESSELSFNVLYNLPEELTPKYAEITLAGGDPRGQHFQAHLDRPVHCRQVVSDETLHASPIYREVLVPCGVEFTLSVKTMVSPCKVAMLGVMRGSDRQPFDHRDLRVVEILLPHLRKAVALQARFTVLEWQRDAAYLALDSFYYPATVLQRDGTVLFRNKAMRDLARQGRIKVLNERIHTPSSTANAMIRAALHDGNARTEAALPISIPDEDGESELIAVITPLGPSGQHMLMLIYDPNAAFILSRDVIRDVYGLTPSEADVAAMLAEGKTPGDIALILGVTANTVKSHMKHVFDKLDIKRQPDLVRLLLTGPARALIG